MNDTPAPPSTGKYLTYYLLFSLVVVGIFWYYQKKSYELQEQVVRQYTATGQESPFADIPVTRVDSSNSDSPPHMAEHDGVTFPKPPPKESQ